MFITRPNKVERVAALPKLKIDGMSPKVNGKLH